ncbi:hypothetical protein LTR36_003778 [Oleoguttula mirabilis]|uniref:Aminoglycoside phosphotransferase domain-containing protein n=1 Tax=Oleoguttula mirabilis TaxID=1507867 RepID=A0AAV9JI28_9PEZI|nr:hypothetical protein LTR36_003778 [Oleoguttula mirabilis]
MRALRQAFPQGEVPVPEVFGWRRHEGQNFIYMSLIHGPTLREAWSSLTEGDKQSISVGLSGIVWSLQQITHDSPGMLIGSINGGSVQDRYFKLDYEEGPFLTVRSFNDWLLAAATRQRPGPEGIKTFDGSYRDYLPDDGSVYFAHGDLTLGNIILSGNPGAMKIEAIIDWEQAGFYPEYWEWSKLLYGVEYSHEWREGGWVDKAALLLAGLFNSCPRMTTDVFLPQFPNAGGVYVSSGAICSSQHGLWGVGAAMLPHWIKVVTP